MITKKEQKWVTDLQSKKKRQEQKAFVVEGNKSIQEYLLAGFSTKVIYGTSKNRHIFSSRK